MLSSHKSPPPPSPRCKLRGRAFYESLGSPKMILAPMVDQSEFAWRLLTRSFMAPESSKDLLAYSPMLHSRMFTETVKFRDHHFQPTRTGLSSISSARNPEDLHPDLYLDGNPAFDRPLIVQFCANDPDELLEAARYVQPFCDAVDLNLGCPQGIARKGNYGAFLQEDWDLVYKLINKLHENLDVPVTAKMRVLETKEKTLEYAKLILSAGASILSVHGRRREQKGHKTGLADWSVIRHLRDNLPPETVIFANGNILRHDDIQQCLEQTGADGIMSAEGNLYDPSIFTKPPTAGEETREFWRGKDGKGGYRMDAVFRRYMDILYKHVLETPPPKRKPLFIPSNLDIATEVAVQAPLSSTPENDPENDQQQQPPTKKQKRNPTPKTTSPNLLSMQAHLFHLLRPLVSKHTNVRDALARCRAGDIPAFEHVLDLTEAAIQQGLLSYELTQPHPESYTDTLHTQKEEEKDKKNPLQNVLPDVDGVVSNDNDDESININITSHESSLAAVKACKRPWWICQPYVRPLPKEALEKGSWALSKKDKDRLKIEEEEKKEKEKKEVGLERGAETAEPDRDRDRSEREKVDTVDGMQKGEIAREGMVCG